MGPQIYLQKLFSHISKEKKLQKTNGLQILEFMSGMIRYDFHATTRHYVE